MKLAIISDIHSNLEALNAVLEKIDKLNVDVIAALGDFVGYGGSPNEVLDIVRKKVDIAILGNHDAAVIGKLDYYNHRKEAIDAIIWTQKELTKENFTWLERLTYRRKYKNIGFTHGSPVDVKKFKYIYNLFHMYSLCYNYEKLPDISFIGHSHILKYYVYNQLAVNEIMLPRKILLKGSKYLFSVGSVGQPRDHNPLSSFLTYELENQLIEVHRVKYDIKAAANTIIQKGLAPQFANRLLEGK